MDQCSSFYARSPGRESVGMNVTEVRAEWVDHDQIVGPFGKRSATNNCTIYDQRCLIAVRGSTCGGTLSS